MVLYDKSHDNLQVFTYIDSNFKQIDTKNYKIDKGNIYEFYLNVHAESFYPLNHK